MRTAICISGLARTYRKTHASFMRNVVEPLSKEGGVDIFISTWTTEDLAALAPRPIKRETPLDIDGLVRLYQPRALEVEDFQFLIPAFNLSRFTPYACPVPSIVRNGILLAMPSQYKVFKCNALKANCEAFGSFRYDLVLRTRFDFEISRIDPAAFDLTRVNCLYNHNGFIGDYFYGSGSDQMDVMADLFNHYPTLLNRADTDMGPEHVLRHHADANGIGTHVLEGHTFALVRKYRRQKWRWDGKTREYLNCPPSVSEFLYDHLLSPVLHRVTRA